MKNQVIKQNQINQKSKSKNWAGKNDKPRCVLGGVYCLSAMAASVQSPAEAFRTRVTTRTKAIADILAGALTSAKFAV